MKYLLSIVIITLIIFIIYHLEVIEEIFDDLSDCINCSNNTLDKCVKCDTCGICELKDKKICLNGDKDGPIYTDDCISYQYKDNDLITNKNGPILSLFTRTNGGKNKINDKTKSKLSTGQLVGIIIGSIGGFIFLVGLIIFSVSLYMKHNKTQKT
jgi:hypothetical protein